MRKWLFSVLAGLSLLLFLASTALWLRSYWRYDKISRKLVVNRTGDPFNGYEVWSIKISSQHGGVRVERDHAKNVWFATGDPLSYYSAPLELFQDEYPYWISFSPAQKLRALGFQLLYEDWTESSRTQHRSENLLFPLAAISLPSAIAPALWIILHLRRRRHAPGKCPACGYDLRATTARCPECGTPITTKPLS